MATFQPEYQNNEPTNFTGRSQGIPANRAFEVAAEGLSQTVEGLARAKDFQIQQNIRQDVTDIFNVTNQQFGYDEEMGMNAVPPGDIPEEFKAAGNSFKDRLAKTVAARNQGSLTDTHYYTLLNYSMKNVKAKYPGYHQIVDSIYQEVTGERPANSLRAAIKQEWEAAESSAKAEADDLSKAVEKYSNEITIVEPAFFENQSQYSEADTRAVLARARKLAGQKEQVSAENEKLTLESKLDTRNVDKLKSVYSTRVTDAVETNVTKMFSTLAGPKGQNLNTLITLAAQGKATPDDLQLLSNLVADAKYNTQNEIRALFSNPDSFEWVSKISAEERKQIEEAAMARFNYIEERLNNKDFGAILTTERTNKWMGEQDTKKLMETFGGLRVYAALSKISPDLAATWSYKTDFNDELGAALLPGMLAQTFSGDMSVGDVATAIDNDDLSQDQRNKVMSEYVIESKKALISPSAQPQDVINFVTKNFGGDKPAIDEFYERVGPQNHTALYNLWTDPRVIDKVLASGDKNAIMQYTAWVKDKIDELPEMATALANISSRRTNGSIQRNFDIQFNPATKTLEAVPNAAGQKAGQTLLDLPGGPTSGNVILDREIAKQNKMLEPINLAIKNMTTVLDKTKDLTGLDSAQTLQQILNDNGIQITIPSATGKEGAKSGALPFSELESLDPNAPINLTAFSDEALKDIQFNWTDEQAAEALATGNYSGLLNFIGDKEAPKGYNQVYGKNNFLPREDMTLDEVLAFQDEMVRGGSPSSAVGRYQFIRSTLRGLKDEMGLTGSEEFTPELQDQLASKLVERRGGKDFLEGKITREEFMTNLSKEWASLPKDTSGAGYYDGDGINNAYASPTATLAAIDSLIEAGKPLTEMDPAKVDWNSIGYGNIPEKERNDFLVWNNNPIKNSETNLATVRPEMQAIVKHAMNTTGLKFVVGSGKRDSAQQKIAIDLGWSKTKDSRHLGGDAVDIWALDENGQVTFDPQYYEDISKAMISSAADLGYELEWGGNWKSFKDIPHFEFEGNRIIIGERGADPVYNEIEALRKEYGLTG